MFMVSPIIAPKPMMAISLVAPKAVPNRRNVRTIGTMSRAGAESKKAMAGPSPAPRFLIPLNSGIAVHDQTESIIPAAIARL